MLLLFKYSARGLLTLEGDEAESEIDAPLAGQTDVDRFPELGEIALELALFADVGHAPNENLEHVFRRRLGRLLRDQSNWSRALRLQLLSLPRVSATAASAA